MNDKAILLDRDDTLIEDPGYINHPDQVKLLDGVPEALVEMRAIGYKLVVVSNQSGVARGIVTEQVLAEIHDRLKALLAEKGAYLDAIYYCPCHPEGIVPKYRKESNWRKPATGMLLAAAKDMGLDLTKCWVIGNSDRDIEAGAKVSCKTILLDSQVHDKNIAHSSARPDYLAVNLKEAVNIIKKYHRSPETPAQQVADNSPAAVAAPLPQEKIEQNTTARPAAVSEQPTSINKSEQLLTAILDQLRSSRREDLFGEFSWLRFLAGVFQGIVPLCLLVSIYLLMTPPTRDSAVLIALMFAMVFQLMAMTFYTMQGRK